MKTILCYGDSNTYGYNPENGFRYPEHIRWTGRLKALLGVDYRVIEEGCNGRTTVFDDPVEGWKNGYDYLRPCLNSHKPVDMVIIMLGSNDMKRTFHATADQIEAGITRLVETIIEFTREKQGFVPEMILVSPPHIGDGIVQSPFFGSFDEGAIELSKELAAHYEKVAGEHGCVFMDAAALVEPSAADSLHLTAEAHAVLAGKLKELVKEMEIEAERYEGKINQ